MSASPPPTVSWESPESQAGPAPGVEFAPHGGRLVAYIIDSIIISIVLRDHLHHRRVRARERCDGRGQPGDRDLVGLGDHRNDPVPRRVPRRPAVLPVLLGARRTDAGDAPVRPAGRARQRRGSRSAGERRCSGWSGLVIAGAVFYLGYIWIFIDKRRRGWQDLIAGTIVVKQP